MSQQQPNSSPTKSGLAGWIRDWMGRNMKLESVEIAADRTFVSYGMDSVHAMMLVGDLEDHLVQRLSPTLAWDHPTIDALAEHLAQQGVHRTPDDEATLLERIDHLSEEEIDALLKARKRL